MRFIASGSYGCVFKPHLPCQNKSKVHGTIGKVFKDDADQKTEVKIHNEIVTKVDPEQAFTLPILETCQVNASQITNSSSCDLIEDVDRHYQIISPDAGKSLDDIVSEKPLREAMFRNIFLAIEPLFKGLVSLVENGYIHQDIKLDNIMYHPTTKKIVLIDFGIARKINKHYQHPLSSILKADYPYFPPEYKLISKNYRTVDAFIGDVLNNYTFSITIAGKVVNIPVMLRTELSMDIDEELRSLWKNKEYVDAKKVDVYQLGLVLLMLWRAVKKKQALSLHSEGITSLIRNMINPDVRARMTAEQAYAAYKEIIASF